MAVRCRATSHMHHFHFDSAALFHHNGTLWNRTRHRRQPSLLHASPFQIPIPQPSSHYHHTHPTLFLTVLSSSQTERKKKSNNGTRRSLVPLCGQHLVVGRCYRHRLL